MSPTRIGEYGSSAARASSKRRRRGLAQALRRQVPIFTPTLGWCPDLPVQVATFSGFRASNNFVPLAARNAGRFIGPDFGFDELDAATAARAVTLIHQYRTDAGTQQQVRLTAGDGGGTAITLERLAAGSWSAIAAHASATAPDSDRETLWDAAIYPFGAPTRSTAINEAVLVLCGGNADGPTSPVLVTPDGSASPGNLDVYDELDRFSSLDPFRAISCANFDGRINFLYTSEAGTVHQRRLRWSAPGTADPDPSERGAGFFDFKDFGRRGVAVRAFRDQLAVYFEDGVAFMQPTRLLTDAYRPRTISQTRGLLATRAVTVVEPITHFGIFNDGWWFLDVAGRWREAGVLVIEGDGGRSITLHKWKSAFYSDLDVENRHRIFVQFVPQRRGIYVLYPSKTLGRMTTLFYDISTDTVWPLDLEMVCLGLYDTQVRATTTWGNLVGTSWAQLAGTTWGSLSGLFGFEALALGDSSGRVHLQDPNLTARNGVEPIFSGTTHSIMAQVPGTFSTFSSATLEYLNVDGPDLAVTALSGGDQASETLMLTQGAVGELHSSIAYFHQSATHHALRMSGTAPALIRSWTPGFLDFQAPEHDGQA